MVARRKRTFVFSLKSQSYGCVLTSCSKRNPNGSTGLLFKTNTSDFQISLDGKRILIFKDVASVKPSVINLITNWTNALPK
jgi:hypothetical protein